MKKIIALIRRAWLRRKWRKYFDFFLKQNQNPYTAATMATEAMSGFVFCQGLDEEVFAFDRLSQFQSPLEEQKNAEVKPES